MERKKIVLHYLKSWFIFDLLASFPYEWVLGVTATNEDIFSTSVNRIRFNVLDSEQK